MAELLRPRHDGRAMFFPCIDDYFTEYNNRRRTELGHPFGPSLAGAGLAFLLADTQIAACTQVAACCVISGTTDMYIVSHVDCGAYKHLAGIDWTQYTKEQQVASLWKDLHVATRVIKDFLDAFKPREGWAPPKIVFHLEVINLQEENVPEPANLDQALNFQEYNGIRIPS